jgi:hypothetical protein
MNRFAAGLSTGLQRVELGVGYFVYRPAGLGIGGDQFAF